jgi:uncharacterized protein (UPF0262 family)
MPKKLIAITLDEVTIGRHSPNVDHERAVAIYDLLEENNFSPLNSEAEEFKLILSLVEGRLHFRVCLADESFCFTYILSLTPFRKIVKDYFLICDSYYTAIRTATPSQIEAIDMGRRGLHNEGSKLLQERLNDKVAFDFETARRLFTLISTLIWKG